MVHIKGIAYVTHAHINQETLINPLIKSAKSLGKSKALESTNICCLGLLE